MTSKEGVQWMGSAFHWTKNIGCQVSLTIVTLVIMVILWESPPPSLLSYSSLSTSQIQTFISRPPTQEYFPPADTSSDTTPAVPTADTDAPSAEQDSNPKKRPIETLTPDPRQSASPVNNTTVNPINATSDVLAKEDTELLERLAAEDTELQPAPEKYIIPLLSHQVGNGNQLTEYKAALTTARILNRTLCLVPFFRGPKSHAGALADKESFIYMEERYEIEVLSKYVNVMKLDECVDKCESRLDDFWQIRHHSGGIPRWYWRFNDTPHFSFDYNKEFVKWKSTAEVAAGLGARNDAKCVGLGGLWPGLAWRGNSYAVAAYLQHSKKIMKIADLYQKRALGSNDPNYIAVHWRFEEWGCRGRSFGLCFQRGPGGSVIMNGRASETWNNMTRDDNGWDSKKGFNGVLVTREDISGAISDRAVQHGVRSIYLSTDGWLRGPEAADTLKWVVQDLRNRSFAVAGLWMVEGLPNFNEYFYVHSGGMRDLFGVDERVSTHMIALVEQEICLRSPVFIGSGQSSWSFAVASMRRGRILKQQFNRQLGRLNLDTPPEVMEQAVIEKILTVQWTVAEDEAPDGWLDYDACEDRLLRALVCSKLHNSKYT